MSSHSVFSFRLLLNSLSCSFIYSLHFKRVAFTLHLRISTIERTLHSFSTRSKFHMPTRFLLVVMKEIDSWFDREIRKNNLGGVCRCSYIPIDGPVSHGLVAMVSYTAYTCLCHCMHYHTCFHLLIASSVTCTQYSALLNTIPHHSVDTKDWGKTAESGKRTIALGIWSRDPVSCRPALSLSATKAWWRIWLLSLGLT